ncbi:MAG: hypothetical protein JRJ75_10950 [Deltaproteobacteria bacterium]|nr:hypothetical protein [Deltaproteobacteria bacterium]
MDDRMIDRYITEQIRKRGITLYDIIGGEYIDPDPGDKGKMPHERARYNRFSSLSWDLRLCELLTEGEFDAYNPYKNLAIPIKDLVRYWWNNIVDQEAMIEEILEDILTLYKDRMLLHKRRSRLRWRML